MTSLLADLFKSNIARPIQNDIHTKHAERFIQAIRDVKKDINKEELVKWAAQNWYQDDALFVIRSGNVMRSESDSWLLAGSSALHQFLTEFNKEEPSWKFNDTDIFIFNQDVSETKETRTRTKLPKQNIDIIDVFGNDCGPGNLVQHFDLAPCRIGTSGAGHYIISKQCLASILCGGLYVLPEYVRNVNTFIGAIPKREDCRIDVEAMRRRWVQLTARIRKYEQRGFIPLYVPTDVYIPSLFHRSRFY